MIMNGSIRFRAASHSSCVNRFAENLRMGLGERLYSFPSSSNLTHDGGGMSRPNIPIRRRKMSRNLRCSLTACPGAERTRPAIASVGSGARWANRLTLKTQRPSLRRAKLATRARWWDSMERIVSPLLPAMSFGFAHLSVVIESE